MIEVEEHWGCHDLCQSFLHKGIVLIIDHPDNDDNDNDNDNDDIGIDIDIDDCFTQGILLNRVSDLQLPDRDIV